MAQTFSASVKDWAQRTKAAQEAVMRSSIEDVIDVASAMVPVDTGHLKNTLASDLNGAGEFAIDAQSGVAVTIENMVPGDTLHIAWTAAYAQRINSGFVGEDRLGRTYEQAGVHFVERAAANWPEIVDANAEHLKP